MFIFVFHLIIGIFNFPISASLNKMTISIFENAPKNVSVMNLKNEVDKLQNNIQFDMLLGLSQNKYFHLNKNWDLIVQTNLDRDKNPDLCKEMAAEYLCIWTGVIMFDSPTDIISLRVEIKDVNDNIPYWSHPIVLEILENNGVGKTIDLTQAQDDDSPPNNVEKYDFLSNQYSSIFRLTQESSPNGVIPKLIIEHSLDHETNQQFVLLLRAVDGAPPYHAGLVNVTIKVLDQNDNSPTFSKEHFSLSIFENHPLHKPLPLNVTATDSDSGQFGSIIYQISDSSPADALRKFAINDDGIITIIRNIDFDAGEKYFKFFVIAKDRGNPPLSASATVEILVKDVNDQPPTILVNPFSKSLSKTDPSTVSIVENNMIEQPVARITATDSDSFENDYCNCTLAHSSDFKLVFERNIQKMTIYRLLANKIFDREIRSMIKTTVICSDTGSPPMTSRETLLINVEDVNDNNPTFDKQSYSYVIPEGNAPNTVITKLNASDDDSGLNGKLKYFLSPYSYFKDPRPMITVNENGEIIAVQPLDRETNLQGYRFQVNAVDHGKGPRSGTTVVEILLKDINDCKPKFSEDLYSFEIEEDFGVSPLFRSKLVGTIKASDADIGDNGISSLEIHPRDSPFKIVDNKYIKTCRFIDREIKRNYFLTVIAIDGAPDSDTRHTTSTTVNISISDVNDNAPQFYVPRNESIPINVSYNEEPGFVITTVQATDIDEGESGRISYQILRGNIYGLFDIDAQKGKILIREFIQSKFKAPISVTIVARDHGTPSLSSTVVLRLLFTDTPAVGAENSRLNNRSGNSTQTNQILIMIIVTITCVICIGLITIICLMARGIVFRQRYCKNLAEKQMSVDDRNSTLVGHGYYPAMISMGDSEFDTLGHYRHSLLDNPYCTLQMTPINYNNNINSMCYNEKLPKDRYLTANKLLNDQQNGSDSDSGHGNSLNNNPMPCDSKDNLVFTSFGTFNSQSIYSPISSFPKSSNSPSIAFAKVHENVPSTFVKYST